MLLGDSLLVPAGLVAFPLAAGGAPELPEPPFAGPFMLFDPLPLEGAVPELVPEEGAPADPEGAEAVELEPALFWLDFDEPELSHAANDRAERSAAAISQFLFMPSSP